MWAKMPVEWRLANPLHCGVRGIDVCGDERRRRARVAIGNGASAEPLDTQGPLS